MCRIAGIVHNARTPDNKQMEYDVRRMTGKMAHGGPDDEGFFLNEELTVCFGHRRLSLLDLSAAGHQPMITTDGTLIITFNGEIYNYLELRTDLQEKGHQFRTHTDTEVILYAFREWGVSAFSRFNGMFAFGLYDTLTEQVYLVRDSSGIKPLYYTIQDNTLVFASEVKAFLQTSFSFQEHPCWKIYFLSFGFIPEPCTTLKQVYMLPKGSYLQWNIQEGRAETKEYLRYRFSSKTITSAEAVQQIRNALIAAVQRHLIADAPIGIFLSGGIDSSLLALLAGEALHDKVHTLSVVFEEKQYSEKKYQQTIVNKLQGNHTYYTITAADFTESLPDIMRAMDQPSMDGINTYFISRCAREEGLKAVLSGLGADELLGGYPSFRRTGVFAYTQLLPSGSYRLGKYFTNDKLKKTAFLALKGDVGKYLYLRGLFNPETVAAILDTTVEEVTNALQQLHFGDHFNELGPGNFASWIETNHYMQNLLLKDSDMMSMWHGIEIRVPFLDKEFIETVLQIHPDLKFNSPQAKHLLIAAFKELLPEEIWNRPKQGFTFPFQQWMKNEDFVGELLASPNRAVHKLSADFMENKLQWSRLWAIALTLNLMEPVAASY